MKQIVTFECWYARKSKREHQIAVQILIAMNKYLLYQFMQVIEIYREKQKWSIEIREPSMKKINDAKKKIVEFIAP